MELTLRLHATTTLIRIDMDKNTTGLNTIVRRKIFFDLPTYRERQSSIRQISLLAVILHVKIRGEFRASNELSSPSSRDRKKKKWTFRILRKAGRLNVLTKIVIIYQKRLAVSR